jgi:hypothetical protein
VGGDLVYAVGEARELFRCDGQINTLLPMIVTEVPFSSYLRTPWVSSAKAVRESAGASAHTGMRARARITGFRKQFAFLRVSGKKTDDWTTRRAAASGWIPRSFFSAFLAPLSAVLSGVASNIFHLYYKIVIRQKL